MEQTTKHISGTDVEMFLEKHLNITIKNFVHIQEGKHSDAFLYINNNKEYIARFNVTDEGFLKDKYAYENFSNPNILIPKILEIGSYNNNLFFCISEKVFGETVKEQYGKQDFSSLPIQFETVEAIKATLVNPNDKGFGKWKLNGQTEYDFDKYFSEICIGGILDWTVFKDIPYFDKNFVEYLLTQAKKYSNHSINVRELVHGDFGVGNLFMNEGKVSGIIDWAHSFYGDHFWDVGRIVLFCPNKKETTKIALDFYKSYPNYKERIAWGVYCVMLKNYGVALQSGQEASCLSSAGRIKEIEERLNL
ncbi:MAG: phosphotransferase [Nanoarchaeota archaeon]